MNKPIFLILACNLVMPSCYGLTINNKSKYSIQVQEIQNDYYNRGMFIYQAFYPLCAYELAPHESIEINPTLADELSFFSYKTFGEPGAKVCISLDEGRLKDKGFLMGSPKNFNYKEKENELLLSGRMLSAIDVIDRSDYIDDMGYLNVSGLDLNTKSIGKTELKEIIKIYASKLTNTPPVIDIITEYLLQHEEIPNNQGCCTIL